MAHHLFMRGRRCLAVADADLALIKHLFLSGCAAINNQELLRSVSSWTFHGPGVWTDIEADYLAKDPRVFSAAIAFLSNFEGSIPADYLNLNAHLPGLIWQVPQGTERIAGTIADIRDLLIIETEQSGAENPIPSGTSDADASGVPDSRGL